MTKKELRQLYASQRKTIEKHQTRALVDGMIAHLQQIALPPVRYILSFKAIEGKLEVPIHFIEDWLLSHHRNAIVCYPKADFETSEMDAYANDEQLEYETKFGIVQPAKGTIVQPLQIDLVLVPLLAFDDRGYRIGYGKGFYDRYLAKCRTNVLKIGVSYFDSVPLISDTDQYDVSLNYCVTPQRLYVF